jgi:hypothetical protein
MKLPNGGMVDRNANQSRKSLNIMCCLEHKTASVIGQMLKTILACRYESTSP